MAGARERDVHGGKDVSQSAAGASFKLNLHLPVRLSVEQEPSAIPVTSGTLIVSPNSCACARVTDKPLRVGPYRVPAGTPVATPLFAIHNTHHNWVEPHAFKPERWLGGCCRAGLGFRVAIRHAHCITRAAWAKYGAGQVERAAEASLPAPCAG